MNTKNATLCWNPGTDQVALIPWPDSFDEQRERGLTCSTFACLHDTPFGFEARKARVFMEAMHLIVRDGCDPMAVHRALLGLDEYRHGCAADMPGIA